VPGSLFVVLLLFFLSFLPLSEQRGRFRVMIKSRTKVARRKRENSHFDFMSSLPLRHSSPPAVPL
jgi:hypothetical protein